jgi:hypothetical protein
MATTDKILTGPSRKHRGKRPKAEEGHAVQIYPEALVSDTARMARRIILVQARWSTAQSVPYKYHAAMQKGRPVSYPSRKDGVCLACAFIPYEVLDLRSQFIVPTACSFTSVRDILQRR